VAYTAAESTYDQSPLVEDKETGATTKSDDAFIKLQSTANTWAAQQVKLLQIPAPEKDSKVTQAIDNLGPLIEQATESGNYYAGLVDCRICSTEWRTRRPPDAETEDLQLYNSGHKPECYLQWVLDWAVTYDELKPLPGFFQRTAYQQASYTYHVETERPRGVFESTKPLQMIPVWKHAECKYLKERRIDDSNFMKSTPGMTSSRNLVSRRKYSYLRPLQIQLATPQQRSRAAKLSLEF
jgi:hypothetical protein